MDFIKYFCCCIFDGDDKVSREFSHIKTTYLDEIEDDIIETEDDIIEKTNYRIRDENMDDDKDFIFL